MNDKFVTFKRVSKKWDGTSIVAFDIKIKMTIAYFKSIAIF